MRKDVTDDPSVVAEIMNRCDFVTLALVDAQGPYSVPVSCAMRDGVLYFHSAKKGRKIEALRLAAGQGGTVAFSAAVDLEPKTGDMACKYGAKFRGVLGSGTVRFIEGREAKVAALNTLMRKHAGRDDLPYDDKILNITEVVAIDVVRATARLKLS